MKKFSAKLMLTAAVVMVSSALFAGSIDYLSNQSAKYLMSLSGRTAATDAADIVAYNPAGTALMGEGLFIDLSNQTMFKPYSQDVSFDGASYDLSKETWEQSEPTYFLPNLYIVYNAGQIGMGKLAVYGQVGVTAGGGSLEWDGGTAGLLAQGIGIGSLASSMVTGVDAKISASSVYYDLGAGAAYSFLEDMISVSAGFKYVIAQRTASIDGVASYYYPAGTLAWTLTIDNEYEYEAAGFTPVFGLDIKPMKELTIGVRYEMETNLEFEYEQKKNSVSVSNAAFTAVGTQVAALLNKDNDKLNQNLPQILGIGAEYVVTPELAVNAGATIYFIGDADMEGYEDYFGTGYEVSVGASYKVMEPLKVAGSIMYTSQGAKDDLLESYTTSGEPLNTVSANPVLDSIFFGLGATYLVMPNLDVTLAVGWVHYLPEETKTVMSAGNTISADYSKEVYNIALGVGYKM